MRPGTPSSTICVTRAPDAAEYSFRARTAALLLTFDRCERSLVSSVDTRDMADPRTVLLQGTLDLLILRALSLGSNHGLGIARRVEPHRRRHGGGNR